MKIRFLPEGLECTLEEGKSILKLASEAGVAIDGNCAGNGTCGKCKVRVVSGNDHQLSKEEKTILTDGEIRQGYRLACKFYPGNDVAVEVPLAEGAIKRKTKLAVMPENFKVQSDLREEYGAESETCGAACYGLAVDIGTTTVVGHLWNLDSGELTGVNAVTNPQGAYGADVISRIMYAGESRENLDEIHQKIIQCVNEMIAAFSELYHIKKEDICRVTVAGNTTMSHLFMGIDPKQLALAPFTPVFVESVSDLASRLGIGINPNGSFYLMPNIAGHVGSDITAGIIATDLLHRDGVHLLIDVGTNGEIVLTGRGMAMTCSTAAGPAFEGASIFQGMRAAEGAIEKIQIGDDVRIQVIGKGGPIGICGSGIIDAVAQLIEAGLIDWTGKFIKPEAMKEKNIPEGIISRFRKGERGNEFVLAYRSDGDDVVILQKDIREVQLAKAAISAGIRIMMKKMGVSENELDGIHIAGAFGNYIDIDSALTIGLFPKIDRNKIISEGNTAGVGVSMALLSAEKREEAERVAAEIEHVELASYPEFQDEYLKAMSF